MPTFTPVPKITRLAAALVTAGALAGTALVTAPAADATPVRPAACGAPTVVYHAQIVDGSTAVGYVDLEHNLACHSVRAHVHSIYVSHPGNTHGANAWITRDDGAQYVCGVPEGGQDCYTDWMYDADPHKSYATGAIDMYPVNYDLAQASTPAF